jgi:hypothetical protein
MQTAMLTLRSKSPILMNPMTDETLDELFAGAGARKGKRGDLTQEQVAEKKVIRCPDSNQIGIPMEYLMAALVNAGRQVKFDGKRNLSTATSSLVPGLISLGEMFYPFKNQTPPEGQAHLWIIDKRRGVLQANGVAVAIIRPKVMEWEIDVSVDFDETELNEAKVRDLFDKAGQFIGLGDFRPACKGPFGRFTVKEWAVVTQEVKKAA